MPLPDGLIAEGLRQLYGQLAEPLFALAGRAVQIVSWDRTHRFCGQCGAPTEAMPHRAASQALSGVRLDELSPALSGDHHRHRARNTAGQTAAPGAQSPLPGPRYSVVAGYVEPGESLEESAQREVLEEVGIRIKSIRYFGSPPWPFPNSLMIGFTGRV